jgi:hypothetical protein
MRVSRAETFIRRQTADSDSLTMTGMTGFLDSIRVLEADRFHDGILIRFADGTSVLYTSEFLYEHRGADGNREVADDPPDL